MAAAAPGTPAAAAAAQAPSSLHALSLFDLPDPLLDAIFSQLGLSDLAAASCASRDFHHLSRRALSAKTVLSAAADLPLLPRAHNLLLMGGCSARASVSSNSNGGSSNSIHGGSSIEGSRAVEGSSAAETEPADGGAVDRQRQHNQRRAVLSYLPKALHHAR